MNPQPGHDESPYPALADRAFARAAGSEPVDGNAVRLLLDARENYPAWLDAIHGAENSIQFESYIIDDDGRARSGVQSATARQPARLDFARSSQDDRGRRADRLRFRVVRQREMAGRRGTHDGTLA